MKNVTLQVIKRMLQSSGLPFCNDKDKTLVEDVQSLLGIWREHSSALVPEESNTDEGIEQIVDDGVNCPSPNQDETRIAISRPKNNKATSSNGLPVGLFQAGCFELIRCINSFAKFS